jgi:hypothetical protein
MRRLRRLGAAVLAVVAIGAVLASSAFATATTTAANWYTGTTGTLLSGSATLTASASGSTKIVTVISGEPVEIQASSVTCVGCSISNSPSGAHGTGKLRFSGLTLVHPAPPCTVTSPIETAALTIEADWMEGTSALVKFIPTSGSTGTFMSFTLSCLGTFPIKGTLFGKTTAPTGTQTALQEIQFTAAGNIAAGGMLAAGSETATLTGVDILQAGGTPFGVH